MEEEEGRIGKKNLIFTGGGSEGTFCLSFYDFYRINSDEVGDRMMIGVMLMRLMKMRILMMTNSPE